MKPEKYLVMISYTQAYKKGYENDVCEFAAILVNRFGFSQF